MLRNGIKIMNDGNEIDFLTPLDTFSGYTISLTNKDFYIQFSPPLEQFMLCVVYENNKSAT